MAPVKKYLHSYGSFSNPLSSIICSPALVGKHTPYSSSMASCTLVDCNLVFVLSYVVWLEGKYVAAIPPIVPLTIIPNINPTK